MRMLLMLVVCPWLLALPALAVEEATDYPLSGLEFGLPSSLGLDDFGLRELDGYDFSWTRRTSATRGWRIGSTVYADHDSDESSSGNEYPDYWVFEGRDRERDLVRISLRVQKLFVSEPRHGVSLVLGVGPAFGYEHSSTGDRTTREYVPDDPQDDSYPDRSDRRTERDWDWIWAGAVWDAGVEWRVSRQFTVGARYQWSLTYGMQDEDIRYIEDGEIVRATGGDGTSFGLAGNSVDLVATFWY